MKRAIVVIALTVFLSACGGGTGGVSSQPSQQASPQVSVSLLPASQQSIDQGQTVHFTASVTNDSNTQGVSWSLSGSGCSGSACGTLTNTSSSAATYDAPSIVSAGIDVSVTATSVMENSASKSTTVVVDPAPVITTTSLPDGTTGASYSATLRRTGGTGALSWSLATGTLPAGLTLDTKSGLISGIPTTAGTYSFTVQATDSASSPLSVQKKLSITVGTLAIATTSLPEGSKGLAYSATLQADYAVLPFSWSISAGSLPNGLTLDVSTGRISGTPTGAGTSDFTVTVKDSGTPAHSATQQLSITIVSHTVVIATTSLSDGTQGVAYSATLQADYAVIPVSWSVTGGSLPSGLTLDANTGLISGTPTVTGTSTFTVTVTDSSNPAQSASQQLSITINPGGAKDRLLSGHYTFLLNGYDSNGNPVAEAGSFVADGLGNIQSGVEDINSFTSGSAPGLTFTGTYTVGADHRGTITLTNSHSKTFTMAIALGTVSSGVAVKGSILEFDSSGNLMSGLIDQQDTNAFSQTALNGGYVFSFTGSDSAMNRLGVVGEFTASGSGGITVGLFDANDYGVVTAKGSFTGANPAFDTSNGRAQVTLVGISPAPADYIFYAVSAAKWLAMSLDNATSAGLVTGEVDAQGERPFASSSLSGVAIISTDSSSPSSSSSGPSAGSQAALGFATFDGSGNVSLSFDVNDADELTTLKLSGTSTVEPDGRFSLDPQGASGLVGYLIKANQGLILGTDTHVAAGFLVAQSSGTFSTSSLNGTFFFGTRPFAAPPVPPPLGGLTASLSVGVITFDGNGNLSGTKDSNQMGTLDSNQTISDTYSVSSNGRVMVGSNSLILYIVSPTKILTMRVNSRDPNPTLGFARH